MAALQIVEGPNAGQVVPLGSAPVILGRNSDCDVVLSSTGVSREHARIERREGGYWITDMQTRNHTFVNGKEITTPTRLQNNDQIRIADCQLTFLAGDSARDETEVARPLFQALAEGTEEGSSRFQFQVSAGAAVEEECRRLRQALEINHIFLVRAEASSLLRQLHEPGSPALQLLGRGFHRVVVLDAAAGLNPETRQFDLNRFLRSAYEQMVRSFGLRASAESFHVENVSQVLKDEPRSLFCLLNVQLIPATELRRLRGFTQEAHQVLFLCCGERDLLQEEQRLDHGESSSSLVMATVSPFQLDADEGKLHYLLEISAALNQTRELTQLLPQIIDTLFQIFRQADRGFLILAEEGENNQFRLRPRVVKTRRAGDEGTARFARSIVRQCLQSGQALLGDDAQRDDRLQLSQSVVDFRIRSVMCVPLCGPNGRPFGVIQLDTQDRGKKFSKDDLKLLLGVANQAAIALENARLNENAVQRERLQRDLELARQVQLSFLPTRLPELPGYQFGAAYKPRHAVGGDWYDFIPLPDGRLAITVGDVAGLGMPAALVSVRLLSETRYCLALEPDLATAVGKLNDRVCEITGAADRFATLAVLVLDPTRHTVTMVSAGHVSPLLYRDGTNMEEVISKEIVGLPLGIGEGYPYESCQRELRPGDSLLILTDGVTDMLDAQRGPFGMAGIERTLQGAGPLTPPQLVDRLTQAVQAHAAGVEPYDDLTLVAFGRNLGN